MRKFKHKADEIIYKKIGLDPDRIPTPYGRLDIYVREKGKVIYEDRGSNQIMTWLKMPLAYLLAGYAFSSFGEHTGFLDDLAQMAETAPFDYKYLYYVDSTSGNDSPASNEAYDCPWRYQQGYIDNTANGKDKRYGVYSRLVYNDVDSWKGGSNPDSNHSISAGDDVFPFMMTKFLFGKGGSVGTPIDPDQTTLNDPTDDESNDLPFVIINREPNHHITVGATQGSKCDNRTVFSVTLPDLAYGATGIGSSYVYDGVTLNEVGLYSSAGLVLDPDTPSEDASMENGMLVAKRYFNGIKKEQSVSFTFSWSVFF